MSFESHVDCVQRYTSLTRARYLPLFDSRVVDHPICCFGSPENAQVITVGVNPSIGEFTQKNRWPKVINHLDLAKRCRKYFNTPDPHPWFNHWTKALNFLGVGYADGSSVHLDLSPRATRVISDLKNESEKNLFLQMIEYDLWIFFGMLEFCPQAKLVIIAGSVTNKYYINNFLQRFAPKHGFRVEEVFNHEDKGVGKTAFHTLVYGEKRLNVFFCSSGPSAKDKAILPQRIKENAECLKRMIKIS